MTIFLERRRISSIIMAAVILLATAFVNLPQSASNVGFKLPPQPSYNDMLNATIKTQKAADSIKGGIRGIDVSKHNGPINWTSVANDNVDFAFIRATCGVQNSSTGGKYQLNVDPYFEQNAKEAHASGLKVGAYHYAWFIDRKVMKKEAELFLKELKKVKITYPVILDIEANPSRLSRAQLSALCKEFADIVKAQGYTVFIYSYNNFFKEYLDTSKLGNYKLWVANYLETPKELPHAIWQHTASGKVSGISGNVDINIAYPNFEVKKFKAVSSSQSTTTAIKAKLRDKYNQDVPTSGLAGINEAILSAIQMEINKQWKVNEPVDGGLNLKQLDLLSEVTFTNKTQGNITYLIQARLFFLGYYKTMPSGVFDSNTQSALRAFQSVKKLTTSAEMDWETLNALLG